MYVLHHICVNLKNKWPLMWGVSNTASMRLRVNLMLFSPLSAVISLTLFPYFLKVLITPSWSFSFIILANNIVKKKMLYTPIHCALNLPSYDEKEVWKGSILTEKNKHFEECWLPINFYSAFFSTKNVDWSKQPAFPNI